MGGGHVGPAIQIKMLQPALAYLAGALTLIVRYANSTDASLILNSECRWMEGNPTQLASVGQLHSAAVAFQMMRRHKREQHFTFDRVVKARPDSMWVHSVAPFCWFNEHTAFLTYPAPADWFYMLPRRGAPYVLRLFEPYQYCSHHDDLVEESFN